MIIRGSRANPLLFHRSINARAPYLGIVGRVLRGTAASNASCRVRAHTTLRLFAAAESIVDTPSIPKFSLGTPRSDTEYRDPTLLADHALALQVNHTWFLSRLDIYIYIYSCLAAITGAIVDNRRSKFPGKRKEGSRNEAGARPPPKRELGDTWGSRDRWKKGSKNSSWRSTDR